MAEYRVEFLPRAQKELLTLPKDAQRLMLEKIHGLAADPRKRGTKKLEGGDGTKYRIRCGDWRAIYEIRDAVLVVMVIGVGHRREVYR